MNNLPIVKLKSAFHKDKEVVQLVFNKRDDLNNLLRANTAMRWSKTMNCWYLPFYKSIIQDLFMLLKPNFYLDYTDLKVCEEPLVKKMEVEMIVKPAGELSELPLEVLQKMERFKFWLQSKRYSENTIGTYIDALKTFLRYYADKPITEITNDDLINFNNHYILAKHFSASYQNQVVNAVKLFFSKVENKKINPELIHRPKRPKLLPNVLSKEEVKLILNAHSNIKHKTMLSLMYSCGLRCGELLRLKPTDIDSKRNVVFIRQSKGRKDRIAPLSEKIIKILREYYELYKPVNYLFEGQIKGAPYDERSLQLVLKQGVEKVKINKPITLHWLRHSYATHLLENGTDLRYIQEILGHSSSKTTEIYTHVSTKNIQKIISPFDYL
ncbi:MAG: site-specific tyrosine recombinase/integron integrase [Bacteroidota bacterium]|jgi:integrase/recombinase XerD